ncbi:DUF456 domain-containing protein [Aeromicrobium sp. 179-A 4D2 NHS]|uniref:DUF456 domain-containing protein n=1 Tax=Aeromicrobium sp. 179-A 4D2 NHS TaxID=3142375 RepID=UPI0039A11B41
MEGFLLDLLVGLAILFGLVGAIVQVVPGGLVVAGAVAIWGVVTGGTLGWSVTILAVVLAGLAMVLKYLLAGRYLQRRGVPNRSIMIGAVLGVIGFFVIPVVGLFVGFVGGTYVAELQRLRDEPAARRATGHALRGVGISILVELTGALVTTGIWLAALLATRL